MNDNNLKEETRNNEEILENAFSDMVKALNSFGCKEVLNLLVVYSREDFFVHKLLERYPAVVAIGQFLYRKPIFQVDEKTFQSLMDANPDIWIKREKNNPEEERNICKKPAKKLKKNKSHRQLEDSQRSKRQEIIAETL
jgi:hypothetical protein